MCSLERAGSTPALGTLSRTHFVKNIARCILNLFPRPFLIRISISIIPFLRILFKGDKHIDPIDNSRLSRFLPYGYDSMRSNALSPSTLSLERHRLLWLYLQNETDIFSRPIQLLHIAPEQAYYKRLKEQPNINYTSLDLYSPIADIKADIRKLPFKNDIFDVVICNHVLEHIQDDELALSEIYRVLKKGGFSILQIPLNLDLKITYEDESIQLPEQRKIHFGQYDHVRTYGLDFFKRLRKAGFKSEAVYYSDHFSEKDRKKYGIENDDIIPLAIKD